jgi:hypothetical protein
MNQIEIDKIIEAAKIEPEVAARVMFPGHRYPKAALRRIAKAGSGLSAGHLNRLSVLTGLSVEELFGGNIEKLSGVVVIPLIGAKLYFRRDINEARIISDSGQIAFYPCSPKQTVGEFLDEAEDRASHLI